ncbi:RsmE family RNA methyltransferase [Lacticaseibacillus paracasei]|uniref:RsmE family RNA methyltransferase n=1 Tax=Lacticaseibacillus paracasei TaxID=1597 RepID=UPI0005EBAD1C|nr:16S rRNA (uracil(1498)-N(3))-methyltransferase [Lacticaseibacillus paracasei]
MQRYFTDQKLKTGDVVQLDATIAKHAIKVLRQDIGDRFELVDPMHHAYLAIIQQSSPLQVAIDEDITKKVELPLAVEVVCGVSKGDKSEWIVQKATELGADKIGFFNAQWGTARWPAERVVKKIARLQEFAKNAAEQSHRNQVPDVTMYAKLNQVGQTAEAKLVAYEESAKQGEHGALISALSPRPASLCVVFGPEGGLAPEELSVLTGQGFIAAGLGPRILRAETAPLYLLSAVSVLTELQATSI